MPPIIFLSYLWFNSIAYIVLGLWCASSVDKTAATVGFTSLTSSGRCEYTTVYCGLQIALGILFGLSALRADARSLGIIFALVIYASLVALRAIGLLRFWPVAPATLMFASFELLMLLIAIALYYDSPT
jgi:hypothetical protein